MNARGWHWKKTVTGRHISNGDYLRSRGWHTQVSQTREDGEDDSAPDEIFVSSRGAHAEEENADADFGQA